MEIKLLISALLFLPIGRKGKWTKNYSLGIYDNHPAKLPEFNFVISEMFIKTTREEQMEQHINNCNSLSDK